MDAIYVFEGGIERYIISCIDLTTRFAFALCYKNLSSLSAKDPSRLGRIPLACSL